MSAHNIEPNSSSTHPKHTGLASLPRYEFVIDACCFLFMFVNMGITSTTFNMFQPYINALPSMSDTLGSIVVSTRMLFAFLSTFIAAAFYRKLDCRLGVSIACMLAALGSVVFSFSTCFPLFCLGSICTGTSYGLGGTVAMTLVIGRWFSHNKATALGIASMGTGLAAVVLPPVVTHLIETESLSTAFLFEATLSAGIALLVFILLRNRPSAAASANNKQTTASACRAPAATPRNDALSLKATKTDIDTAPASPTEKTPSSGAVQRATLSPRDFRLMQLAVFLLGGASVGSNAYLSVLLKSGGFDAYLVAAALSLSGICLMGFKFVAGVILDKAGTRRGSMLFFALFFSGLFLLCLTPLGIAAVAFAGVFLCYAGQPISSIGVSSWTLDFSSDETRAQTVKRLQLFFTAGTFLCCLFPGALYDISGTYEISYIFFAAAIAVSGFIVVRTYRKHRL